MWRTIDEFPRYHISSFGRVKGIYGRLIKQEKKGDYMIVNLHKEGERKRYHQKVHRLVAIAFVVNPLPGIYKLVDHINRDTLNNMWSNLRWVSNSLNRINNNSLCVTKKKNGYYVRLVPDYHGPYTTWEQARLLVRYFKEARFTRLYESETGCASGGIGEEWFKA